MAELNAGWVGPSKDASGTDGGGPFGSCRANSFFTSAPCFDNRALSWEPPTIPGRFTIEVPLITECVSVGITGPAASVATGAGHTCGLTPGGVAYCWGDGSYGQLGTGGIFACFVTIDRSGTNCPGPQPVRGNLHFASITAGVQHSCGLVADGTLYCWGLNDAGDPAV